MKKLLLLAVCLISSTLFAQDMSFSKPGKNFYRELPNPSITSDEEWSKVSNDINVSFASDNVRYPREKVPAVSYANWNVTAWRGEKVNTQILVWTKKSIPKLSIKTSDLINEKGNRIDSKNVKAAFVRYVMTDEFGNGCDARKNTDLDSSLVEDPIDIINVIPVHPNSVQPVWVTVHVPGNMPAGRYSGTITIKAKESLNKF